MEKFYTLNQLLSKDFPEPVWVVEHMIPQGLTVMSAAPASYKTWLLLDIAINVSGGYPLFDKFPTKATGVLMIDEENNIRMLHQRLRLLGVTKEQPIHFMVEQNFRLTEESIEEVIEYCIDNDIELITIDSLVRIHRANENDATQMSEVFSNIKKFTELGVSVIVTHHHRKSRSDNPSLDMRGSSDVLAAVDCHLALKRNDKEILVTQTKNRYAEELPPIELEVISQEDVMIFKYLKSNQPMQSKKAVVMGALVEFLQNYGPTNQKDLGLVLEESGLKANAKTLRNWLNEMEAKEILIKSSGHGNELLYSIKNKE